MSFKKSVDYNGVAWEGWTLLSPKACFPFPCRRYFNTPEAHIRAGESSV
jgi:hypothetical protein